MKRNQKINCTVESCKYNNCENKLCELDTIMVTPNIGVNSAKPDESKCSSYECE